MGFVYQNELYIDIRDAIIDVLKLRNTMAGDNIRLGRRIPIENPFAAVVPDSDELPLCVVSFERCMFEKNDERGGRTQNTRKALFQIDGYVSTDFTASQNAGLTEDEYVAQQLDLFASQIVEAIEYYALFRPESNLLVPESVRLRDQAELWINDIVKTDFPGDAATLVGAISVNIIAHYEQDRRHEDIVDLETIFQEIRTGDLSTDPKKVYIAAPYVAANYFLTVGSLGHIWKFGTSDKTWYQKESEVSTVIRCIHGMDDSSFIVACGNSGTIIYSTDAGESWSNLGNFPDSWTLTGCWVIAANAVWVAGRRNQNEGRVWFWDGFAWSLSDEQSIDYYGIVARSNSSVYIAARGVGSPTGIWYYDGSSWQNDDPDPAEDIESIFPDSISDNFYCHSDAGTGHNKLWYGSFGSWIEAHSEAYVKGNISRSLWVDENGKVWMVGQNASSEQIINSWDGNDLITELNLGGASGFHCIYGENSDSIMAVGVAGRAYYYDGNDWIYSPIGYSGTDLYSVWAPQV